MLSKCTKHILLRTLNFTLDLKHTLTTFQFKKEAGREEFVVCRVKPLNYMYNVSHIVIDVILCHVHEVRCRNKSRVLRTRALEGRVIYYREYTEMWT